MNSEGANKTDIRVIYKSQEFEEFYDGLSESVKVKFEHVFNVIQTVYARQHSTIHPNTFAEWFSKKVGKGL